MTARMTLRTLITTMSTLSWGGKVYATAIRVVLELVRMRCGS